VRSPRVGFWRLAPQSRRPEVEQSPPGHQIQIMKSIATAQLIANYVKALASFIATLLVLPWVAMAFGYGVKLIGSAEQFHTHGDQGFDDRLVTLGNAGVVMSSLIPAATAVFIATSAVTIGMGYLGAPRVYSRLLASLTLGFAALCTMFVLVAGVYLPLNIVSVAISAIGSFLVGWWLPHPGDTDCEPVIALRGIKAHFREQLA
jgi:hypothetical protein